MKRYAILLLLICLVGSQSLPAQFFSENFDSYADGTTTGAGSSWTATCGGCAAGDFFEVRSGSFQASDVNAFSTWTSQNINIAGCGDVQISMDAIETGDHEGLSCACGINVDYFDIYYSIDAGPFTVIPNWNGDGEATHTLSGDSRLGVFDDADWGSTTVILSGLSGATLQLQVQMRNTAGSETLIMDNVLVDCILPVELTYFHGEARDNEVHLEWAAADAPTGRFDVQRSQDGRSFETLGAVPTETNKDHPYAYTDGRPLSGRAFYRLRQVDQAGKVDYSDIIPVTFTDRSLTLSAPQPNPNQGRFAFELTSSETQTVDLRLVDLSGRLVQHQVMEMGVETRAVHLQVNDPAPGVYFLLARGKSTQVRERVVIQ